MPMQTLNTFSRLCKMTSKKMTTLISWSLASSEGPDSRFTSHNLETMISPMRKTMITLYTIIEWSGFKRMRWNLALKKRIISLSTVTEGMKTCAWLLLSQNSTV